MYWTLNYEPRDGDVDPHGGKPDGRFVLHRHQDGYGPHYDLRLEQGNALAGWRIDGDGLDGVLWATEKAAHPIKWLDTDGDAVREDAGTYRWLERGTDVMTLELSGAKGVAVVRAERAPGLSPSIVRGIVDALSNATLDPDLAPQLVSDGATARRHAIARLCGLGRELDGAAFDESLWQRMLHRVSLDEIHSHLRAFEVRFDAKYPPSPVSVPEVLPEDAASKRNASAWAIARS